jgi:hypothetical protein
MKEWGMVSWMKGDDEGMKKVMIGWSGLYNSTRTGGGMVKGGRAVGIKDRKT